MFWKNPSYMCWWCSLLAHQHFHHQMNLTLARQQRSWCWGCCNFQKKCNSFIDWDKLTNILSILASINQIWNAGVRQSFATSIGAKRWFYQLNIYKRQPDKLVRVTELTCPCSIKWFPCCIILCKYYNGNIIKKLKAQQSLPLIWTLFLVKKRTNPEEQPILYKQMHYQIPLILHVPALGETNNKTQ